MKRYGVLVIAVDEVINGLRSCWGAVKLAPRSELRSRMLNQHSIWSSQLA